MAPRFTLKRTFIFALLFGGVFFIFSSIALAEEMSSRHVQIGTAIVDRYNADATVSITKEEQEWIQWGIAHEGIPVRALHHAEQTWLHDTAQQSASVYEGVYTWEQGISDYQRGEKQRAFETLGHLLHLVIDAHPTALTGGSVDAIQKMPIRTWRDVVQYEHARATATLFQEGLDTLRRFFTATQRSQAQQPNLLIGFFTKVSSMLQERLGFARTNIKRAFQTIRVAFVRVPATSIGGVAVPQPKTTVARAEQEPMQVKEDKKVHVVASLQIAPASFPLATSVPLPPPPPVVQEQVQPDIPEVIVVPVDIPAPVAKPVIEMSIPQDTTPHIPESPTPPPPPPQEELDVYGFPLGTIRTFNRVPPETTLTTTPAQLTNTADATFVFTSSKEGTFFCTIDHGEEGACTSPVNSTALLDGNHTFTIRARDIWGTYDATPATYTWTIDTTSPHTTLTQSPATRTNSRRATFAFTASEEHATFHATRDSATWQEVFSPFLLTDFTNGEHTVTLRAIDAAGNAEITPVTVTWTVDGTPPPAPMLTSPTSGATYTTTTATVFLDGVREEEAIVTVNESSDGMVYPTSTTWQKTVACALGETAFVLHAIDAVGNTSAPTTITITRTEGAPPPPPPDPPPPPPPPVAVLRIKEVHFDGGAVTEYVVIENSGTAGQLLTGFTISDAAATPHTYTFGAFMLNVGVTVALHTGDGVDTSTDVYWNRGSGVWNDGGDTAFLKDSSGTLIDSVSW